MKIEYINMTKEENIRILRKMGYYIRRDMTDRAIVIASLLNDWAVDLTGESPEYAPTYLFPEKYHKRFEFTFGLDRKPDCDLETYVWIFNMYVDIDGCAYTNLFDQPGDRNFFFDPTKEPIDEFIKRINPVAKELIQTTTATHVKAPTSSELRLRELGHSTLPFYFTEENMRIAIKLHELAIELANDGEFNIKQEIKTDSDTDDIIILHYIGYSEETQKPDTVLYTIDMTNDDLEIIFGEKHRPLTEKLPTLKYKLKKIGDIDEFIDQLRETLKESRRTICYALYPNNFDI